MKNIFYAVLATNMYNLTYQDVSSTKTVGLYASLKPNLLSRGHRFGYDSPHEMMKGNNMLENGCKQPRNNINNDQLWCLSAEMKSHVTLLTNTNHITRCMSVKEDHLSQVHGSFRFDHDEADLQPSVESSKAS